MIKEDYIIKNKAWCVDHTLTNETGAWIQLVVYAETEKKAKSRLMKKVAFEFLSLSKNDKIITVVNIPVVRYKFKDLVEFEGSGKTKSEIKQILKERARIEALDRILEDESIVHVYIKKDEYFYGKNWGGFSDSTLYAGVYKKDNAVAHARECPLLSLQPCHKHNLAILEEIKRLRHVLSVKINELDKFLVKNNN
jgi:hypothetical protein